MDSSQKSNIVPVPKRGPGRPPKGERVKKVITKRARAKDADGKFIRRKKKQQSFGIYIYKVRVGNLFKKKIVVLI